MAFDRQGIFLNAVMLAAVTAVVAAAIQRFVPAWQPGYLVAACFLVALEAGIMQMIFRAERMWLAELARYLVPELTVMLVLMRIAATLSQGSQLTAPALAAVARRWLYDPLSIFDMLFLCFIIAGLIVGGLAHTGMNDLLEIAPQPFEGPARDDEGSRRHAVLAAADRTLALRRISSRFVAGGVLLLPKKMTYDQIMEVVGEFKGRIVRTQPRAQKRRWR